MSEYGEAWVQRHEDGTVTVVHADDLIQVSRALLGRTDHYRSGVLILDTAGEYRYRRIEQLDEHTDLFERITEHGHHVHAFTHPVWNGMGYTHTCRCGTTQPEDQAQCGSRPPRGPVTQPLDNELH